MLSGKKKLFGIEVTPLRPDDLESGTLGVKLGELIGDPWTSYGHPPGENSGVKASYYEIPPNAPLYSKW